MSKESPSEEADDCEPWQIPHFESGENNNIRYQQAESLFIRTHGQQEQTREQTYETGFAQGHREGLEKGQAEIRRQVAYLESLMAALASPLHDLDKQVIDELVELIMAIVRQMIRRELKLSPGEIVAIVKEALSLLPVASGDIKLELHPDDAAIVRTALGGADAEPPWEIIEDPLLSRGGCRVATNKSRIDASVESRINAVIASAMGGDRDMDKIS